MEYKFFQLVFIFFIYAFSGWVLEVTRAALREKKFVNRGFLSGPYCPIYGFGVIAVLLLLSPFKDNLLLLFILSMALASLLEFIVGFLLEKLFYQKWWDYSGYRFNIKGYICIHISIFWGLACVAIIHFIQPLVNILILQIPVLALIIFGLVFLVGIIVDTIFALIIVLKIRKKFILLADINNHINNLSLMIGKNIADNVVNIKEITDKNSRDLFELRQKYKTIISKKIVGYGRIMRAFPGLKPDNIKIKKVGHKKVR